MRHQQHCPVPPLKQHSNHMAMLAQLLQLCLLLAALHRTHYHPTVTPQATPQPAPPPGHQQHSLQSPLVRTAMQQFRLAVVHFSPRMFHWPPTGMVPGPLRVKKTTPYMSQNMTRYQGMGPLVLDPPPDKPLLWPTLAH